MSAPAAGPGVPCTGLYTMQIRFNFMRHPDGRGRVNAEPGDLPAYSIKWKRGSKKENKGVIGPVSKCTARGDYSFNQVIELECTMTRKSDTDIEKGWEFKWIELEVREHSLDDDNKERKRSLFDTEFNLASALPPQKDISPHILLQRGDGKRQECSLSLSIGYRLMRRGEGEKAGINKLFVCGAPSGVAAHGKGGGGPLEKKTAGDDSSKRSQSQPWWRCGDLNAADPEGKPAEEKTGQKRSKSAGGGGEWWRCGNLDAATPPSGKPPPVEKKAENGGSDRKVQFSEKVDMKFLTSSGSVVSSDGTGGQGGGSGGAAAGAGGGGAGQDGASPQGAGPNSPDDTEEEVLYIRDEQEGSNPDLNNSGRGGAPSVASSGGTIPLTPHLYTRRPSRGDNGFLRSTQLPMSKPSPKKRPSRIPTAVSTISKSLRLKKGGDLESPKSGGNVEPQEANRETVCNKQVFYHEVDVRMVKLGGVLGPSDDSATQHARSVLACPQYFSTVSTVVNEADHATLEVELGELSIPRLFTLLWGYHTDFPVTVHALLNHKNFKASRWDINDDNPQILKWCGSQYNNWVQSERKIIGDKVPIVEDAYFATFKLGDMASVLYIHTSQRAKNRATGPRIETVYKFWTNRKGVILMDMSSKLVGIDKGALSRKMKKRLVKRIEKQHEVVACRAVQKAQIYLMRKSIRPSLAMSKRLKIGVTGEKKRAQITLTQERARERLRKHGASMGTLGIITLGKSGASLYNVRVRRLGSYFESTGGSAADPARAAQAAKAAPEDAEDANSNKRCRIADLPWKDLGDVNTVVNEALCLRKIDIIHERLKGFTTGNVQREGFTQIQVQMIMRVMSAYPNNNPQGGVLEACFSLIQIVCSVSLLVVLETPNAVDTIQATWRCSGSRFAGLSKYASLVESLQKYQAKRSDSAKQSSAAVSKTLLKHYNITEDVLERFSCSLVTPQGSTRGTLYITRSWLCFSAQSKRVMISTFDITKVSVKRWLLGSTVFVHAENRCIDPLDFNNPHKQSSVFEFSVLFQGKVEAAIMSVVRGGGRPRVRVSQQIDV